MKREITIEFEGLTRGKKITATYYLSEWKKNNLHRIYVNDRTGKTVAYVDLTTHPMTWKWVKKTMSSEAAETLIAETRKAIHDENTLIGDF